MSFGSIITYPFSWLLLTLYEFIGNYGIAIILFAVVVKLILLPFQMKSKRSTMRTSRLTPIMKELEKKHEGNKQKYQEEVAKLYKEEKINPLSGCLWSLIPFPILIALYSVIRLPFTRLMRLPADAIEAIKEVIVNLGGTVPTGAYREIGMAEFVHRNFDSFADISDKLVNLDFSFLGLNLGQTPNFKFFIGADWSDSAVWLPQLGLFLVPIVSALLSYFSIKISTAGQPVAQEQQQGMMKGMQLMMPLMSLYICFIMPAALGIYWIANSILAIIQDSILNRHLEKVMDAEDAERKERMKLRESELERKRAETEKLKEMGATKRNQNTSKKKIQAAQKNLEEEKLAAERAKAKAERKAALGITDEENPSAEGNRRYARGRAYMVDRFAEGTTNADEENTAQERSETEEDVSKETDDKA